MRIQCHFCSLLPPNKMLGVLKPFAGVFIRDHLPFLLSCYVKQIIPSFADLANVAQVLHLSKSIMPVLNTVNNPGCFAAYSM